MTFEATSAQWGQVQIYHYVMNEVAYQGRAQVKTDTSGRRPWRHIRRSQN